MYRPVIAAAAVLVIAAAACSNGEQATRSMATSGPRVTAIPSESAVPVESSPPGDIPDSTQFVAYRSAVGHYSLKHPEGWAATEKSSSVSFTDKLVAISVDIVSADGPRTPSTVRSHDEPDLRRTVRAFEEVKVESVSLPAGAAVLLRYRANSEPNDVTGRAVRLEIDRFEIYSRGRLALLSLSAPAGSDNVDVWKLVSESFAWTG